MDGWSDTPNADRTVAVLAACEAFSDTLTAAIIDADPHYDVATVRDVVSIEAFMCAQDMAALFAPMNEDEREAIKAAIRDQQERS